MKNDFSRKETSFLLILFIVCCPLFYLQAQIEVEPTGVIYSTENLITNVFLGDGVEVTNIEYSGTNNSVGFFSNGTNDVGINRGIIMSTGLATSAASPDGATSSGETSGPTTDIYLNSIASGLRDLSSYSITFIPVSDTLRFRYTFASEEYPEFACTNFNDIFGFFIYGDGINGPFPNNAENIALIPELSDPSGLTFTDLPVTINNVNPGTPGSSGGTTANCSPPNGSLAFSDYYNDNSGSATCTYDGILDVFTAQVIVTPCEEYTIVLSIADVGDAMFDSAVFLEAKSFGTGSLEVETVTVSLDGTITEGCSDGVLSFALPNPVENDLLIDYTIFGTAENGVDFQSIPLNLTIPAGSNSVSVPIIAFADGITEGIESIGIDVQRDVCNRDTCYYSIRDNAIVPPQLQADTTIAQGEEVQLMGALPIPDPVPPFFENETDFPVANIFDNNPPPPGTPPTISPIQVFGVQPVMLQEDVIKRVCINVDSKWIGDVDVFLVSPGGQIMELTTDNGRGGHHYTETCFVPTATNPINFGSSAHDSIAPFTGDWQAEGIWSDLWDGDFPTNGTWELWIKDDGMGFPSTLLDWSICFTPLYQISYTWEPITGLSCTDCPDPIASPDVTTQYILTATDTYGCVVTDTINIEVIDTLPPIIVSCSNITTNSIEFNWDMITGATGFEVNVNNTGWIPSNGINSHLVDNLTSDETVTIQVRPISNISTGDPSEIGTITCTTLNCIPPTPTIDNVTNVSCFNGSNGSFTISTSSGTPPFEYRIDGIETNSTGIFNNLTAGNYLVVITDNTNCPTTVNITLTESNSISSQTNLISNATCNGQADGSISVSVNGGAYPYSYTWNITQTDSLINGLPAEMYYVTVTDNNACTTLDSILIEEPDLITLSTQVTSITCNGSNDGTALALVNGGTAPFTYLWDANANNQDTQTATNLSPGIYFVTVSDDNNCSQSTAAQVIQKPLIVLDASSTLISCAGLTDGTATVIASGGAGNFSYQWNDASGQTTETATNLQAFTYTVTVTDLDQCTESINVTVDEPMPLNINEQITDITCFGENNGSIQITPQGGTSPYNYTWSDDPSINNPIRTNLPAGALSLTITDDSGCSFNSNFNIDQPVEISLPSSSEPVGCLGGNTGSATVTPTGGDGTYFYQWDASALNQNTPTASNLSAGVYTVTVTDASNCSATTQVEIFQSAGINIVEMIQNVDCFGQNTGSISLAINGGNSPYNISWSGPNGFSSADENISNLLAGDYFITVTDNLGCPQTNSFSVIENQAILLTLTEFNLTCNSIPNGTATVTALGGEAPYSYLWSNGANTATINDLAADTYIVTVTDSKNCSSIISTTLTEPDPISITPTVVDASCFGLADATVTLVVNGGNYPYNYAWSDATSSDSLRNNLSAGIVDVTITDGLSCETVLSITIGQPAPIELLTDSTSVSCNGEMDGSAMVVPSGGSGTYTFAWDAQTGNQNTATASNLPAGIYSVTVSDGLCSTQELVQVLEPAQLGLDLTAIDINCFGNNTGNANVNITGGTTPYNVIWEGPNNFTSNANTIDNLFAGNYNVTIEDSNNCIATDNISIQEPATGISSSMSAPNTICFGSTDGTATVSASGGSGNYNYLWSFNNLTTASVSNLPPGEHFVTITDGGDCSRVDTAFIIEQAEITLEVIQEGSLCFNGTDGRAQLQTIFEGTIPADPNLYTISWSNGQNTLNADNLQGGSSYTIMVTDALGCTSVEMITIDNPSEIGATLVSSQNVSCTNGQDGSATVDGLGGTAPYDFEWNVNNVIQTSNTAIDLPANTYLVTISDANGCSTDLPVIIEEPIPLNIEFTTSEILCPGDANGTITASTIGGSPPYSFEWSTGETTNEIGSVVADTYFLTVTDNKGCTKVESEIVNAPPLLQASIDTEEITCFGDRDGRFIISPTGGVPPYSYSMDGENFDGSPIRIGLTSGTYTIYIKDNNGCIWSEERSIEDPPALEVDPGDDLVMELGDSLRLSATVQNNVGEVFIRWLAPYEGTLSCEESDSLCFRPWTIAKNTINYTVLAIDENGCEAEERIKVEIIKDRPIHVATAFTPNADGHNDMLFVHGKEGSLILSFRVYNRWGELVYENTGDGQGFDVNSPNTGWNGEYRSKPTNPGVFLWHVEALFLDGQRGFYQGSTTLLR